MNRDAIVQSLRSLNLKGASFVLHCAAGAIEQVEGGAEVFCSALLEVVGNAGTIVVPTFTARDTLIDGNQISIPYQVHLPVSRGVDAIAETFRKLPGAQRTNHPTHSFAAWGANAARVLSTQRDNNPLGPIKKLNVIQGSVVLIGAPLSAVTAIHLAEETARYPYLGRGIASRINVAGFQERVVIENLPGCGRAFDRLETRLDPAEVRSAAAGDAACRAIPIRYLVRLASNALREDPAFLICDDESCSGCATKRAAIGR